MFRYAPALPALLLSFSLVAQPSGPDKKVALFVDGALPELVTLYKDLHANPEVSFMEKNTAAKMAAQLRGHPDALHLAGATSGSAHLGLEQHPVVLDPREGASRADELGHAGPVEGAAVAGQR